MPAVYQLVPGSMIAKLWFNSIFPPPVVETDIMINGTNKTVTIYAVDEANNIFSNLMVRCTATRATPYAYAFQRQTTTPPLCLDNHARP